ncbi:MAG: hypothetical protein ACFE8A_01625 [Candidatus Hodarchaeota archaeon]
MKMNRVHTKIKLLPIVFLFSIFIPFLILPFFSVTPFNPSSNSSEEQAQTKYYDVNPVSPPLPSMGIHYSKIFNISASEDDAWTRNTETNYLQDKLELGRQNDPENDGARRICLRWNLSIPEGYNIASAYLNLTLKSSNNYDGFKTTISAFDNVSTPDFSDTSENIRTNRERTSEIVVWQMPYPTMTDGKTYTSPNIGTLLQKIIDRDDWKNNSIFGIYIEAGGDESISYEFVDGSERLDFHSFDGSNLYKPKLIVEWEDYPGFRSTPSDQTINNNTLGYHLEWTAADDNPTNYTIECNYTGSFKEVQNGTWQTDVEIRYDIPKLDISIVNYTINITDADGNFDWDSVLITVTDLGLPRFSSVRLFQGDANFTYDERDYFICGDGPFTLQMINSTPINNIELWLTAYYPDFYIKSNIVKGPMWVDPYSWYGYYDIKAEWILPLRYDLKYDAVSGSFSFTPPSSANYAWAFWAVPGGAGVPMVFHVDFKTVNSMKYKVLNFLNITVDGGSDFTVGDYIVYAPVNYEMLNKDIRPPNIGNPEFIEPDDPDEHYEISLRVWEGDEYESGVSEVLLYYSVDDGTWREVSMLLSQGFYYGDIPSQLEEGVDLDYYIVIRDVAGNEITTRIYSEKTVDFGANPVIVPLLILILAMVGAISTILIYKLWRRIFSKKYKMEMKMEPKKIRKKISKYKEA